MKVKENIVKEDIDNSVIYKGINECSYMSNEDYLDLKKQMEEIMNYKKVDIK